jgi:hypothetical protein
MSLIHDDFICEGVWLSDDEADLLNGDGDATLFLLTLRRKYIEQDEPFALSPVKLRETDFIPSWGIRRYVNSIEALRNAELIYCAKQGGHGRANTPYYKLAVD